MLEFDYVIVGAGSAGCVLARRLSEDASVSVLVLEAGGKDRHPFVHIPAAFPRLFQSKLDWNFETTPQDQLLGRSVYMPRGKMLGGSSSLNAMMWIRGSAADYDLWAKLAGDDWSYDRVLPFFQRAEDGIAGEDQHGHGGPLPISQQRDTNPLTKRWLEALREIGIDTSSVPNSGCDEGAYLTRVNQSRGRRVSAVDGYLRPALDRPNLCVLTHASCGSIAFEDDRAVGVGYWHKRHLVEVRARREVLLTAGAINSPQLLMCSGIGPPDHLRQLGIKVRVEREQVGKNLQDHLTTGFAIRTTHGRTLARAQSARAFAQYALFKRGLLTSNVAEGYGYTKSSPDLDTCDLELIFVPGPFVDQGLRIERHDGVTFGAVLLQPQSRGEIHLVSADARVAPRIDPRYLSDEAGEDARCLAQGIRTCLSLIETRAFVGHLGTFMQPEGLAGEALVESSLRQYAQTLYHPVGTARMGLDEDAVVDGQLRVRGVKGLRVVDASVMPVIPHGHTHAPTVMIAEKTAALLQHG